MVNPVPAQRGYRLYRFGPAGRIFSAQEVTCSTDEEALEFARHLARNSPVEVWQRHTMIARIEADPLSHTNSPSSPGNTATDLRSLARCTRLCIYKGPGGSECMASTLLRDRHRHSFEMRVYPEEWPEYWVEVSEPPGWQTPD